MTSAANGVRKRVVVVGGGPAGLAAAFEAAKLGARVSLIEAKALGGRALHETLVPTQTWLDYAHRFAQERGTLKSQGVDLPPFDLAPPELLSELHESLKQTRERKSEAIVRDLETSGIEVILGHASFVSTNKWLAVRENKHSLELDCDLSFVCTGSFSDSSTHLFQGGAQVDGKVFLLPHQVVQLVEIPKSVLVVGGGSSGAEMATGLRAMGSEVTWLVGDYGVLPDFERDHSEIVADRMVQRGIKIVQGQPVIELRMHEELGALAKLDKGRTYQAAAAVLCLGGLPNFASLNLPASGLELSSNDQHGRPWIDGFGRGKDQPIYFVGDAQGAHMSWAQSERSAKRAVNKALTSNDLEIVAIESLHSVPVLARAGLSVSEAQGLGIAIDVRTAMLSQTQRGATSGAFLSRDLEGSISLVIDANEQIIVGASALGEGAEEAINFAAWLIQERTPIERARLLPSSSRSAAEWIVAALR